MLNGYEDKVNKGQDMKKGYTLSLMERTSLKVNGVERVIEFQGMVREGQKFPCGIIVTSTRLDNNVKAFWCLPSNDAPQRMWDQALAEMPKRFDNQDVIGTVTYALMRLASKEAMR